MSKFYSFILCFFFFGCKSELKQDIEINLPPISVEEEFSLSIEDPRIQKIFEEDDMIQRNNFEEPFNAYFQNKFLTQEKKYLMGDITTNWFPQDSIVYWYNKETDDLRFLSKYYLGNKAHGLSPQGNYFAWEGDCFEGNCSLYIIDVKTRERVKEVNAKEYADEKNKSVRFQEWISENEFSYVEISLGKETLMKDLFELR